MKRDKWVIAQKEENAKLREINAELLEALKTILDDSRTPNDVTYVMYTRELQKKARAAIAKAEGQS